MINIIYPVYQGDDTDIKRKNDTLNFKSLKIAGDFNDWQIEPMELNDADRQPFWLYSIDDSKLKNCNNLNDRGELLVHFKFIDDYNNWFTVSDYGTEPDEHNNINNVEVVRSMQEEVKKDGNDASVKEKMQEENIQEVTTDSESEVLDEGPGSPAPSLKDKQPQLQELVIEDSDTIPNVLEHPQTALITDENLISITNNNDDDNQERQSMSNTLNEVNIEPETSDKKNKELDNDTILEEHPNNIPELISPQQVQKQDQENLANSNNEQPLNVYSTVGSYIPLEETNTQIVSEEEQNSQMPSSSQETMTENKPDTQIKPEGEQFYNPNKNEELDSKVMLENPIAQAALEDSVHSDNSDIEKYVDIENHDLTVPDRTTEGYQNILRRLLKEFCSWFSWLFDIFNSSE